MNKISRGAKFGKRTFRLVLTLLVGVITACGPIPGKALVGQEAPVMRLYKLADGEEVTLQQFTGKPIVLVFWRTDCGNSKRTLQAIEEYAHQPKNEGKQILIAANLDPSDRLTEVKSIIAERKLYSFQQMMSGNEENDQAFIRVHGDRVPYIVLIDENGIINDIDSDRDIVINPGQK